MFDKEKTKKLQNKIDELSDKIDRISDKQDSQFTDIVILLKRIQDEIKEVRENVTLSIEGDEEGVEDSLYEDVKNIVMSNQKASSSFLQRKFGIGYSRASKLMDTLEKEGVVGPVNGSVPKKVFLK
jgi:S-DNA-T family DNA segregation ATPase FtsK/SpoIIIE